MRDARTTIVNVAALACLLSLHTSAAAQTHDHLKCFRTEDATEAVVAADLESAAFGLDAGCTIEAKVREHCVPASADVINDAGDAADFQGDDLTVDRLCYKVDCPKRALPAMQVSDRFGSRVVSPKRSKLVCLPTSN